MTMVEMMESPFYLCTCAFSLIIISNSRVDRLKIALSTENAMEDSNLLQVKCDVKVLRYCVSTKMCVSVASTYSPHQFI